MKPIHIVTDKKNIYKNVIMPGDPLRAKYIAQNFLKDAKLVNDTRNMLIYSGTYKGKKVTVASSGMGIASVGIYAYELYKFYNVKNIIRIGTSGALSKEVKINDIVIADSAYSPSTFNKILNDSNNNILYGNKKINNLLEKEAMKLNLSYKRGMIYTTDVFDLYINIDKYLKKAPKDILISEMEAFGLFATSKYLNKNSSAIVTVVDSKFEKKKITAEMREKNLNDMIKLALETIIKL